MPMTANRLLRSFLATLVIVSVNGLFGITSPANIKITKVQADSPADGKIQVGDVIVGAGGAMFKKNTRRQLADAIDQTETEKARGVLTLTLVGGKKVDLQLKVLGTDSGGQKLPLKWAQRMGNVSMCTHTSFAPHRVEHRDSSDPYRAKIGGAHALQLSLLGARSDDQPDSRLRP